MATDPDDIDAPVDTGHPDREIFLAGRYRVVRKLDREGMGAVYLALDTEQDGREVDIRVLPAALARSRSAIGRLREAAELARRLTHSHVISFLAFEEAEEGPFLVSDHGPGRTLARLLEEDGPIAEERIAGLFTPLAEALDYAHHRHVVHRDVRPANILVREDGTLLLANFGVARELEENLFRVTSRRETGTLPYMSPEQLIGKDPTPAQDVYSLAATMYECLTGRPPFAGEDVAGQIGSGVPEELNIGNRMLSQSIGRGLAKSPDERPPSCMALLEGQTAPRSAPSTGVRWDRTILFVGALLATLILIALILLLTLD